MNAQFYKLVGYDGVVCLRVADVYISIFKRRHWYLYTGSQDDLRLVTKLQMRLGVKYDIIVRDWNSANASYVNANII
jgi:hypothetical protein